MGQQLNGPVIANQCRNQYTDRQASHNCKGQKIIEITYAFGTCVQNQNGKKLDTAETMHGTLCPTKLTDD